MNHLHCLCGCELDAKVSTAAAQGPRRLTAEYAVSRKNNGHKHNEGMKHITAELRNVAIRANTVDNALHEFVSAKFCRLLQESELLEHPSVTAELATYELLHQR